MCTFVRELVNISVFGPWQPLMEHLFWKFMYPHLNYGGIIYDETFQKEFFFVSVDQACFAHSTEM